VAEECKELTFPGANSLLSGYLSGLTDPLLVYQLVLSCIAKSMMVHIWRKQLTKRWTCGWIEDIQAENCPVNWSNTRLEPIWVMAHCGIIINFISICCPDQQWGPSILLSNGY
jgi:hypothetical protein